MSKLRPECGVGTTPAIPDSTALYLIQAAVAKRRSLIHGRLNDRNGGHCAMGCFWADNRGSINQHLVDEVSAVNDSVPPSATPSARWRKVNKWLKWKLATLAGKS